MESRIPHLIGMVWAGGERLEPHWEDYDYSSPKFYVKNKEEGFVPIHYEELS